MNIKEISYKNYRNLKDNTIIPCEGINIICGDNAQGKTNFLESIWIFTGGRSFRGSKDSDLISFGEKKSSLFMKADVGERLQTFSIDIISGKRTIKINKVTQPIPSALVGKICAVSFSPEHLALIKDGPGLRRKFLDTAICQTQPMYAEYLLKYNHILSQRNMLLRTLKKNNNLIDTLDIWEEKLAEYGAEIICSRISYTKKLKGLASEFYMGLSSKKEKLSLQYKSSITREDAKDKTTIKEEFKKKLEEARTDDIAFGFTTKGPHRDDLDLKIDGKSARIFSSQGQQRSIVLAMKLAEAEIVKEVRGEMPIILLDDVLSELDANRQHYLLNSISEKQVFITCCEPELSKRLVKGYIFEVSDGNIKIKS